MLKLETRNLLRIGKELKDVARHPYAWPGGYIRFAYINGGMICGKCLKERFDIELYDATCYTNTDTFTGIIYEDNDEYCENCNKQFSEL